MRKRSARACSMKGAHAVLNALFCEASMSLDVRRLFGDISDSPCADPSHTRAQRENGCP